MNLIAKEEGITRKEVFLFVAVLVIGLVLYFLLFSDQANKDIDDSDRFKDVEEIGADEQPLDTVDLAEGELLYHEALGNLYMRIIRPSEQTGLDDTYYVSVNADSIAGYTVRIARDAVAQISGDSGTWDSDRVEVEHADTMIDVRIPLEEIGNPRALQLGVTIKSVTEDGTMSSTLLTREMDKSETHAVLSHWQRPRGTLQMFRKDTTQAVWLRTDLPQDYYWPEYMYVFRMYEDNGDIPAYQVQVNKDGGVGFLDSQGVVDANGIEHYFRDNTLYLKIPLGKIQMKNLPIGLYVFRDDRIVAGIDHNHVEEMYIAEGTAGATLAHTYGYFKAIEVGCSTDAPGKTGIPKYFVTSPLDDNLYFKLVTCDGVIDQSLQYLFELDYDRDNMYDYRVVVDNLEINGIFMPDGTPVNLPQVLDASVTSHDGLEVLVPLEYLGNPTDLQAQVVVVGQVDGRYVNIGQIKFEGIRDS